MRAIIVAIAMLAGASCAAHALPVNDYYEGGGWSRGVNGSNPNSHSGSGIFRNFDQRSRQDRLNDADQARGQSRGWSNTQRQEHRQHYEGHGNE